MMPWPFSTRSVEAHRQLLGTLWLLLKKIQRHGLLSVAGDIDARAESPLFTAIGGYDKANEVITVFICDLLRVLISYRDQEGSSARDTRDSIERYINAYRQSTALKRGQQTLFDVARLSLLALVEGQPPAIAIEHARQGVPAAQKPSFIELEVFLRGVENVLRPSAENLAETLDEFYDSIGAPARVEKT